MQSGGILITNNADTHPPESWALATAQSIIAVIGPDVPDTRRIPAMKLQAAIAEMLTPLHAKVQDDEQAELERDPVGRLGAPHDPEPYLGDVVRGIQALAADTPWASEFSDPDMQNQIRHLVGSHFATAQHLQRVAHAMANPAQPAAKAFLARLHGA